MNKARAILGALCAALAASCVAGGSLAVAAETPTVTVEGFAEVKYQPARIRLQCAVVAEGDHHGQALENLARQEQEARKQLAALGAIADSIRVEDPELWKPREAPTLAPPPGLFPFPPPLAGDGSGPAPTPASILGAGPRESLAGALRPAPTPSGTEPKARRTVVYQLVLADFPYRKTPAESQGFADQLVNRLESTDALGRRKLTDPEGCPTCGSSPLATTFSAVAVIDDKERDRCYGEAFASARSTAEGLSRAAGKTLGPVLSISGPKRGMELSAGPQPASLVTASPPVGPLAGPPEITSRGLGKVTYRVAVTVTFALTQ